MLTVFFNRIENDPRISTAHIGLYVSLFSLWERQGASGPLEMFSRQIMPAAKISSCATYVRLMHDLDELRYVRYEPCFYKRKASRIRLTGF
ncbi:hypothetical protein SAMN04487995_5985 [Dyadobacter koreensis]|uniref:Transcriptional regulator n=1 Tax=Dyadobacter koreensis TaxID=408657 RepID=A0A1H7B5B6_9BACT|nr:hypothetical protein SAMN04487995_5985 [Dyadobacter koreensis]